MYVSVMGSSRDSSFRDWSCGSQWASLQGSGERPGYPASDPALRGSLAPLLVSSSPSWVRSRSSSAKRRQRSSPNRAWNRIRSTPSSSSRSPSIMVSPISISRPMVSTVAMGCRPLCTRSEYSPVQVRWPSAAVPSRNALRPQCPGRAHCAKQARLCWHIHSDDLWPSSISHSGRIPPHPAWPRQVRTCRRPDRRRERAVRPGRSTRLKGVPSSTVRA